MKKLHEDSRARWIASLDWAYYILIVVMIVVFLLYRADQALKWVFLAPAALAVIARVASTLLKQRNR